METIKRIRNERGLSQEVLAAKAGISPVTLIYAERAGDKPGRPGRSNTPSLSTLRKIAKALDVSVNDLLPNPDDHYTGMSLERLTAAGREIGQALEEASEAKDWARVDELLTQSKRVSEEIKKLNPPLCTIHYTPDKKPEVTFFRAATEEEKEDLEKKLGEYTVTDDLLLIT